MKRFLMYLLLQGKRALRLLPQVLAVTLLLTCAASLAGAVLSAQRAGDTSRHKVLVGAVVDAGNPYIQLGIHALETFDAARDEISFLVMEEGEALARLRAGTLSAYIVVPDDFLDTMYSDDVHPIRFVSLDGAAGLDTLLAAELADAVARLMTDTQNAQYGAVGYAMEHPTGMNPYEADDELIDRQFAIVLDRDKLFQVETVGLSDSLSFGGYYFCGLLVAFLLLWGIGASPLFSRRPGEMSMMLRARGFGAARQVLGEFCAFYLLMLLGAACAAFAGMHLLRRYTSEIPELQYVFPPTFAAALAFLVLMLGTMQFFLYELSSEHPGGILLQFLNAVAQGYAAGCFYPRSFFPEGLRRFGEVLPAGVATRYLSGVMSGSGGSAVPMALCALTFLALSVMVRRLRLREGTA